MNTRAIADLVWWLLAAATASLIAIGAAGRTKLPSIGAVLRRLTTGRPGQLALMLGWAWLGWHAFAR